MLQAFTCTEEGNKSLLTYRRKIHNERRAHLYVYCTFVTFSRCVSVQSKQALGNNCRAVVVHGSTRQTIKGSLLLSLLLSLLSHTTMYHRRMLSRIISLNSCTEHTKDPSVQEASFLIALVCLLASLTGHLVLPLHVWFGIGVLSVRMKEELSADEAWQLQMQVASFLFQLCQRRLSCFFPRFSDVRLSGPHNV